MIDKSNSDTLTTYAILNALAEGSVFGIIRYLIQPQMMGWEFLHYLLLYNVLAFGLMPLVGILTDLTANKHLYVQTGFLMIFCGLLFPSSFTRVVPLALGLKIKTVFLGVGTAMFRSAAAGVILRRSEHTSRDIGIFLSTAPLGLATVLLKPTFSMYLVVIGMFVAARDDHCREFGDAVAEKAEEERKAGKRAKRLTAGFAAALTVGLVIAAAMRAYLGEAVDIVFTSDKKMILLITVALVAGRAIGGYLSDFVGCTLLSAVSLSAGGYFLLAADGRTVWLAMGLFFLNLTLPALYHTAAEMIPRAPGFAAGMISAASLPAAIVASRFELPDLIVRTVSVEALILDGLVLIAGAILLNELPFVKAFGKKEGD